MSNLKNTYTRTRTYIYIYYIYYVILNRVFEIPGDLSQVEVLV